MKISRNDLCHCGSGKKYKKCCLNQDQTSVAEQRESDRKIAEVHRVEAEEFMKYAEGLDDLTNRANDLIRDGEWDQAYEVCKQLKSDFPEDIDADHRFYEYYKARGDFVKARTHAQNTLKMVESREGFDPEFPAYLKEEIATFDDRIKENRLAN